MDATTKQDIIEKALDNGAKILAQRYASGSLEMEVLEGVSKDKSNDQIAKELKIDEQVVGEVLTAIYNKLGIPSAFDSSQKRNHAKRVYLRLLERGSP